MREPERTRARRLLANLAVHSSYSTEWGWAIGRFGVLVAMAAAVLLFMQDTPAFWPLVGLIVFATVYSIAAVLLIRWGSLKAALIAGLVLDNATLLAGWVFFVRAFADASPTNDTYLILFPIVIIGVVRLGWVLGSIYTALWIGWLAVSHIVWYASDSYDVEQLPIRVLFLAATAGLVMWLAYLLERERRFESERRQQAESFEELKSTLLRTVAHEVRSPVTAIRTAADLLDAERDQMDPTQRDRAVTALQRGVRRLEALIRESSAYAELRADQLRLNLRPVGAGDLVRRSIEAVVEEATVNGQHFQVMLPEEALLVRADPVYLNQVLVHLLRNAVRFGDPGSQLEVAVHERDGVVMIDVANPGPPIAEDDLPHLFEAYYQGRTPDRQGHRTLGLGLAVAQHLALLHGGSIGVATGPGDWTTFTLSLPSSSPDFDEE